MCLVNLLVCLIELIYIIYIMKKLEITDKDIINYIKTKKDKRKVGK